MRVVKNPQRQFGQVDIADIKINLKSRDDIPHILLGLQYIYTESKLHDEVFDILKKITPKRRGKDLDEEERYQLADVTKGRPGMEQWTILVLGVLRLGLNTDYDRIHELANQHQTIRTMLGHGDWSDEKQYSLQSLKENLRLFTPEILDEVNQAVIRSGHTLVKKAQILGKPSSINLMSGPTPLSLRRTFISQPTLICSWMRLKPPFKRVLVFPSVLV
jgi:transposase, IS5 family